MRATSSRYGRARQPAGSPAAHVSPDRTGAPAGPPDRAAPATPLGTAAGTGDAGPTDAGPTHAGASGAAPPAAPRRPADHGTPDPARQRAISVWLCERADAQRAWSTTLRVLTSEQQASWQRWHRVWHGLWAQADGAPGGTPDALHPLVRVCMYCWRVYSAAPLAANVGDLGTPEYAAAWRTVPWWVRDQLRAGATGLRVSHGVCPACARAHDFFSDDDEVRSPSSAEGAEPGPSSIAPTPDAAAPPFLPARRPMADAPSPTPPAAAPAGAPPAPPAVLPTVPIDRREVFAASAFAVERAQAVGGALRRVADTLATPEERSVQIVDAALEEFGAEVAVVARLVDNGAALEVVAGTQAGLELLAGGARVPIDDRWPMTDAVREGRVVHAATRDEIAAVWPGLAAVFARLGLEGVVAVPAQHLGRVHGALLLAWRDPRPFAPAERASLRATAGRLARALVHARLYYAERAAHAAAEQARTAEAEARREADLARADADRQREAAVRANQAKDEFLAVVSHELRTPLQAVLGFSELMVAGLAGPLTDKQRDYVGRVQAAGGQLLDTIENLLGFARAQAGKEVVDAAPFDAAAVVAHVLAIAAPLAERKRLTLRHTGDAGPVTVVSDERKFRQIVTNLVANAVKFTPAGEVEAGVALDGDVLRLTVRDTGVGIPAGQLQRVFEPFMQADHAAGPTTRPVGGTGLGLSIVRTLAQLLGGDVRVESAVGRGSTFVVELPRVLAPER